MRIPPARRLPVQSPRSPGAFGWPRNGRRRSGGLAEVELVTATRPLLAADRSCGFPARRSASAEIHGGFGGAFVTRASAPRADARAGGAERSPAQVVTQNGAVVTCDQVVATTRPSTTG